MTAEKTPIAVFVTTTGISGRKLITLSRDGPRATGSELYRFSDEERQAKRLDGIREHVPGFDAVAILGMADTHRYERE